MSSDSTLDGRSARRQRSQRLPHLVPLFSGDAGILDPEPVPLDAGDHVAGRDVPENEGFRLEADPLCSRRHAQFSVDARRTRIKLVDLESRNGTFVNGKQISEQYLVDGDVVRIGDSFFLLRFIDTAARDVPMPGLLGSAPAVQQLRATIAQLGPSDATALLLGESGTGKEVTANALHMASGRSGPMIAVNCTAIPESLAESQLFGHKAGAFTGAQRAHEGFFRAADGGTLFLDEIGDLSLTMQPKLLRALEEKKVVPVGETRAVSFDVRVVAATNQDLEARVADQSFRGDLFARLAQLTVKLPTLRRRREDILVLLLSHLGPHAPPMAPDLVEALLVYPWPHNIRELIAVATELRVRGAGLDELVPELVTARLSSGRREPDTAVPSVSLEASETQLEMKRPIPSQADLEGLLRLHRGNLSHVAREVGRSRMQVYRWLEKYGIDAANFRED